MATQPAEPSSSPQPKAELNCILDSGAYSAWKLGKPIDLEKYCNWLLANQDWLGPIVALDVINPGDSEAAAEAGFKNLLRMRERGLDPIPVWHAGEDVKWLHKMLDLGCKYIGLAGTSLGSKHDVDDWYALAWSHLVNADGLPVVKVHAFGEGRPASLKRFPWYSSDSTSWLYASQRNGVVGIDKHRTVALRNDGLSSARVPDINSLAESDRAVFALLLQELKIKPEAFAAPGKDATILRSYLAAYFYIKIQESVRASQPIRFHPHGFFNGAASNAKPIDVGQFKLHLVIGTNPMAYVILAKLPHPHALISYFYIEGSGVPVSVHKHIKAFCRDPLGTCIEAHQLSKYWSVLQEYTY